MSTDVDNVIYSTGDPVVAVLIANASVAAEVATWELRKIGIEEPLLVPINAAHLTWPRSLHAKISFTFAFQLIVIIVYNNRLNSEKWFSCTSWLKRCNTWQWCNHNSTGFCLPVSVNYLTFSTANDVIEPTPGFGRDWLSDRSKDT